MSPYEMSVDIVRRDVYPIVVGAGLSDDIYGCIAGHLECGSGFYTLVDDAVAALHGDRIENSFAKSGAGGAIIHVRAGEENKSFAAYCAVLEELLARQMRRRATLVVIGGGVLTDLGGFVAATYMRGVRVVNVPTTLLAQTDAAIGGKVAVNHSAAKNLVGSFYNPSMVLIDPNFVRSLDERQVRAGLAEMIKVAIIASDRLFALLEREIDRLFARDVEALEPLIILAAQTKVALLRDDWLERNLQRVLNFGHTLGHVLETVTGYQELTHGEAIAIGMAAATRFAVRRNHCDAPTAARILGLLERAGLPTRFDVADRDAKIKAGLEHVRLIRDGSLNFVVPTGLGTARILKDVDVHDVIVSLAR